MQIWYSIEAMADVATPYDPAPALRRRYMVGMAVIILLTVIAVGSLEWTIVEGRADGRLVNLADRQRMLSQRIAKCVLAIAHESDPSTAAAWREQLGEAAQDFISGHDLVRDRSPQQGLSGEHPTEVIHLLGKIEHDYEFLAKEVPKLSEPDATLNAEGTNRICAATDCYLRGMDSIVASLADDATKRIVEHRNLARELMVACFAVTAIIALVACEPAVRSISRAYKSLVARNNEIEAQRLKAERTSRSLQESLRFNDAILQTAADAIIVIDSFGTILSANPAAHGMFGAEPGSLVGADVTTLMDDYDREHHSEYVDKYEQTGSSSVIGQTRELVARRGDMERFPIELSVAVMEWDGRRAYTGFIRDISERINLQSRLAQAEKLESIGRLAAGIAHEINTPLQFINANTQYLDEAAPLLMEAASGRRTTTADELEKISQGVREAIEDNLIGIGRVSEIVKAMKEFSHPGEKIRSIGSLNDCIRSTVTISRNRWKDVAELDLQLDEYLPACELYVAELNQALLNLVVNAADAIGDAADEEHEIGKITVRTWSSADSVNVAVEDSGPGIPVELLSKIFDPFFTTKRVGKGTGQGLSIAHDIAVKLHGGALIVENRPEGGARFVLTIPLQAEERSEEPTSKAKCPFAKAAT